MRTDDNNNPAAFTADIARQAKLVLGTDYEIGTPFYGPDGSPLHTARLLGDPVQLTIRVIDTLGYQTATGAPRWPYINLPKFVWDGLIATEKRDVVGYHYRHEGGTAMRALFPNYGKSYCVRLIL